MVLIRSFSPWSAPVLHEPLRDGQERLLDEIVERVRFDIADDSRDRPSLQYVRRIVFMSISATPHQNFRFEFETVKNARADSPARTDSPPALGFSKSRTADTITAAPRRR